MEVRDLGWRAYGRRTPILTNLDLTIEAGERVLLVGPSGSGKSTLLRALAGLLETADAGELTGSVTVDGSTPSARPGRVGLVLQEPGAGLVAATVARDVAFGLENTGMPRGRMPARVASALAAVRLDVPWDTPTSTLSGGQTQRLALAGALALEPRVLLLDEPTAMLDGANAASVRSAVDGVVAAAGLTLVVVEHVLGPWVDLVDRLVVLDAGGAIVADGPVRSTLERQRATLLQMGIWVPGAGPPSPVAVAPGLIGIPAAGPPPSDGAPVLTAGPLTVVRRTRTVEGLVTVRTAARLRDRLAPDPGDLVALVGPSGSGKSTVLHALAGFLAPGSGSVRTREGADPATLEPARLARAIAWIPQWASSTVIERRVIDEVQVTARRVGRDDPDLEERARRLLAHLGLDGLAEADPRHLSGGELRRLAVASALLHGPDVVLADEPTVGQDRHTWAAVVGLLAAYRAAGGAIVTATHDGFVIDRAGEVHTLDTPTPTPSPPTPAPASASASGDAPESVPGDAPATAQGRGGRSGRRPWLAGRAPLGLLLGSALAVPVGVLSPGWQVSLLLIAVQLGLGLAGLVSRATGVSAPLRAFGVRLLPGAVAAVSVAWSTWLLGGHQLDLAGNALTRVLLIVIPSAVLLPFIDTDDLGDALAQRMRLPDRPVVAISAALHRMQAFGDIWTEIGWARRVRGIGPSWRHPGTVLGHVGALTVGLLVRSLRAAAELAVAMDARGFATATRRTWWGAPSWTRADGVLIALAALPLALALLLR